MVLLFVAMGDQPRPGVDVISVLCTHQAMTSSVRFWIVCIRMHVSSVLIVRKDGSICLDTKGKMSGYI